MATHENSIYAQALRVIADLTGGKTTDDSRYSVRRVMRFLNEAYGQVVGAMLSQRGAQIDPQLLKAFCITLTEADAAACGCPVGCRVLSGELPRFMMRGGKPAITFIGTEDRYEAFEFRSPSLIGMGISGRFSGGGNRHGYYIERGTLFVFPPADSIICSALVIGVPESITATSAGTCYDIWADSGVPTGIARQMRLEVLSRELAIEAQSPKDERNNANEK